MDWFLYDNGLLHETVKMKSLMQIGRYISNYVLNM